MRTITSMALTAALVLSLSACKKQESAGAEATTSETASLESLNGTWKADLASLKFEGKPDEYLLQGSTYKCATCIPPLSVAADGQLHPVADRPYYDSMSVKVVDARTLEMRRQKAGKEVSSATMQVSEDGNVLTTKFKDASTPNAPPVEGTATARRAGPAPVGVHAISGQWTPDRIQDYSEDALNIAFRIAGNKVTMNSQGQSYTAEIGGPAVAVQGDTGGTTVVVSREGANGLREVGLRGGKEVFINTIVPSAYGKSMTFTSTDPRNGSKSTWTGTKLS
jgi:hypothetical protein